MGIDQGFDLFPKLEDTEVDKAKWAAFLDEVKERYRDDPNMTVNHKGSVTFTVSEHPCLLKDGHRFRRFSSKISGGLAGNVREYLEAVAIIAKRHFGTRVHCWNDGHDGDFEKMCYGWKEVYDAARENV